MNKSLLVTLSIFAAVAVVSIPSVKAQELLPYEAVESDYHAAPRYRESESHPLRIVGYIFHPIGWVLREAIFRPLSYFAGSTETRRDVMGFREPYDYRRPNCFSKDDSTPDCHSMMPFNYNRKAPLPAESDLDDSTAKLVTTDKEVFFPNVNFDFNRRNLSELGKGQVKQLADLLASSDGSVKIILQGHTDERGTDAYNEKLGLDRARAVKSELAKLGIADDRMLAVSFGETKPLNTDGTPAAHSANRRVETKLE